MLKTPVKYRYELKNKAKFKPNDVFLNISRFTVSNAEATQNRMEEEGMLLLQAFTTMTRIL